ncbi:TPA: MFS transporter [Pseudomonas aeruginosa]|uniref:MFS transporter n=1 Tax=Pseudomonas aeruginosa TaxID=287 RepID=UPI0010696AC6|nr:MFS transporter [Pseudomonas aeruginosa]HCL3197346.1 MFS transporter [Pseudomonas aeruginosa]
MPPDSYDTASPPFVLPTTARIAVGICFCVGFADGVILPFLALWAQQSAHLTASVVGLLLACYSAGELLATPILGGAADRYGRRRVLICSLAGVGTGFLLLPFCNGFIAIAAMLLFIGVCECTLHPTVSTVIADVVPANHLRRAFALARSSASVGRILGPMTGAFIVSYDLGGVFFAAACLLLISVCLTIVGVPETRPDTGADEEDHEPGLAGLLPAFRDRRLASLLLWLLCIEICAGWVPAVLPLFARDTGLLTVSQVGWLFTYGAAVVAVLQIATAQRFARIGGEALAWWSALALAAAFATVLLLGGVAGLVIGMTLLAVNQMILGPLVPSTVNSLAPPHRRATYMAAASVVGDLKDTVGPVVGTLVYGLSPQLPWSLGIPLALVAGFALARRMRVHDALLAAQQRLGSASSTFIPSKETSSHD